MSVVQNQEPELPLIEAEVQYLRLIEAFIFSAPEPVNELQIAAVVPEGLDIALHLNALMEFYASRGIHLVRTGAGWHFQTSAEFSNTLSAHRIVERKMSKAQLETLSIIAYHQPVTRAELEDIRGVGLTRTVLEALFEAGWVKTRGRRKVLGRPLTYGTTTKFLKDFGLEKISDLPGLSEMKSAGLFDGVSTQSLHIPNPSDALELFDENDEPNAKLSWQEVLDDEPLSS